MNPQVILGFDMETDVGSWTPFYEGLRHGTPKLLRVLEKHQVGATFFFTADAAKTHPQIVHMVRDAGHEIGCHSLYHETLGDEIFPIPGLKPVLPEECPRRIKLATEAVADIAKVKMVSFRAPRLWGSTIMLNALEELGYTCDCSYPMYYYEKMLVPYHPSKNDWTQPGDMKILEIPNFADMTITSSDQFGRDRDQWPRFRTDGAGALMQQVDNMLSFYRQRSLPAVLCFYLHPWEFQEMPQGLIHFGEGAVLPAPFIVKNCGDVALAQLDALITMLIQRQAQFSTAANFTSKFQG